MQYAVVITGKPLQRAECESLAERLLHEPKPDPQELIRLSKYAFIDKPEGEHDWARASAFQCLKEKLAGTDPVHRSAAMQVAFTGLVQDLRSAESRFDVKAPGLISEVTNLAFFSGDPGALIAFWDLTAGACRFPKSFYHSFGYELLQVQREAAKIPKIPEFMNALEVIGIRSHRIGRVEMANLTEDPHDDPRIPFWGRAAQFGSSFVQYGLKPDYSEMDRWLIESQRSEFAYKTLHVRVAEIAEACGIAVIPPPEPKVEWHLNLRLPFVHRREIPAAPQDAAPTNGKPPGQP